MINIVLASNSPRRRELLSLVLDHFVVKPPAVEEKIAPGERPIGYVLRTAAEKASRVAEDLPDLPDQEWLILAADTVVVDEDEILGKPADASDAKEILQRLQGKTHQALTGLVLHLPGRGHWEESLVKTDVTLRSFTDQEIQAYIASGDPMDKAGAYAIQNQDFDPVPDFQGCFANVMGLPLCELAGMLDELGVQRLSSIPLICQQALDYQCPVYEMYLPRREGALGS
jgi:MAF protein